MNDQQLHTTGTGNLRGNTEFLGGSKEQVGEEKRPPVLAPMPYSIEREKPTGEETTIEVLREHVAFLQDMLLSRDEYWKKEAERLKVENEHLRSVATFSRVFLAEACEYVRQLEKHTNEDDVDKLHDDDYEKWVRLSREG